MQKLKTFSVVLILSITMFSSNYVLNHQAFAAGVLTQEIVLPSSNQIGLQSIHVIEFNTGTTGMIKTITMTYPAGFNLVSQHLIQASGIGLGTLSVSSQTLTYTVNSAVSVPAGTHITIMMGGIGNAGTAGAKTVSVTTKDPSSVVIDGPTTSIAFALTGVTNGMINTGAVSNVKIATGTITGAKIIPGVGLTGSVFVGTASDSGPSANSLYIYNDNGSPWAQFRLDASANNLFIVAHSNPLGGGAGIVFRTATGGGTLLNPEPGEVDRMSIDASGNVNILGGKLNCSGCIASADLASGIKVIDCTNLIAGAPLIDCDLHGMDLHGKDLHGADFIGAHLSGANLAGANLAGANLVGANLVNADLNSANLNGANFMGANLNGMTSVGCTGTPIGTPAIGPILLGC